MTRAMLVIHGKADKARAHKWVEAAPPGMRIEFKSMRRSLDQNSKLWATLSDIAAQKEHFGHKYPTHIWKCIFLAALGKENGFVPSLDGEEIIPLGYSSSDLSKGEMSELLEFMIAWCAGNGVILHDDPAPSTAPDDSSHRDIGRRVKEREAV